MEPRNEGLKVNIISSFTGFTAMSFN